MRAQSKEHVLKRRCTAKASGPPTLNGRYVKLLCWKVSLLPVGESVTGDPQDWLKMPFQVVGLYF